jgi:hypothetical protein
MVRFFWLVRTYFPKKSTGKQHKKVYSAKAGFKK